MEQTGFEPVTSSVRGMRSPSELLPHQAERVGFEPTVRLPAQQFSRLPDSASSRISPQVQIRRF